MTKNNKLRLIILCLLGCALIILLLKQCSKPKYIGSTTALDSLKYVTDYQRKVLTDKVNVLKDFDTIYVNRWRNVKGKTEVIIDSVYFTAPDTCTPYLRQIENRLFAERQVADSSIAIKDSIIVTQSQVIKTDMFMDSILKVKLKNANDSISKVWVQVKKEKRKGFVKGFIWGFGSREVINQGINLIKAVK